MRLSAWRAAAKNRESMSLKVMAVLQPVLDALGAPPDAHCWVVWGDDPAARYIVLTPTAAGLAICHVRVNVPQEGPRVAGKLVRWSKVQLPDLAIEAQAGHRLLSFVVEQQVIKGVDAEAERIAQFALLLFAAIEGRPWPDLDARKRGKAASKPARSTAKASTTRAPAKPRSRTTRLLKAGPQA